MKLWMRTVAIWVFLLPWALPAFGQDSDQCASLAQFAPPGSLAVTRGEIIGPSSEHVSMTDSIPQPGDNTTHVGYLITGDQVDFVDACQGFSYVRYHGKNLTTTGWIDSRRLQLHGQSRIPLPPDVSRLCSSTEQAINNDMLTELKQRDIPKDFKVADESNPTSTPINYVPVNVEGRPLAVVTLSSGGSCYSVLAQVRTADLKYVQSPNDAESHNPVRLTLGGNGWAMGLSEDVVSVEGRPLILSKERGRDFELSRIDRTGDTQLVCHGRLKPMSGKPVVAKGDPTLCESLATTATPVVMQSAKGHFRGPSKAMPETDLDAEQWGMADLDNTGNERPVGVMSKTLSSGAGCGHDFELQFPLALEGEEVSSAQATAAFQALYGDDPDISRPSDRLLVRVVRHGKQTYVELLDAGLVSDDDVEHAPVESIWKFSRSGPEQVCAFRTRYYEVKPPDVSEIDAGKSL